MPDGNLHASRVIGLAATEFCEERDSPIEGHAV